MQNSKISISHKKYIVQIKVYCHNQNFFLLSKNTFKEDVRYLFNVVILLNTVFNLKLNFELKINLQKCNLKSLDKICQKRFATLLLKLNKFLMKYNMLLFKQTVLEYITF